jgi:hypothetical protein
LFVEAGFVVEEVRYERARGGSRVCRGGDGVNGAGKKNTHHREIFPGVDPTAHGESTDHAAHKVGGRIGVTV